MRLRKKKSKGRVANFSPSSLLPSINQQGRRGCKYLFLTCMCKSNASMYYMISIKKTVGVIALFIKSRGCNCTHCTHPNDAPDQCALFGSDSFLINEFN